MRKYEQVDMEGAGAAAAIEQAGSLGIPTRFMMIRGISDLPPQLQLPAPICPYHRHLSPATSGYADQHPEGYDLILRGIRLQSSLEQKSGICIDNSLKTILYFVQQNDPSF